MLIIFAMIILINFNTEVFEKNDFNVVVKETTTGTQTITPILFATPLNPEQLKSKPQQIYANAGQFYIQNKKTVGKDDQVTKSATNTQKQHLLKVGGIVISKELLTKDQQ